MQVRDLLEASVERAFARIEPRESRVRRNARARGPRTFAQQPELGESAPRVRRDLVQQCFELGQELRRGLMLEQIRVVYELELELFPGAAVKRQIETSDLLARWYDFDRELSRWRRDVREVEHVEQNLEQRRAAQIAVGTESIEHLL